MPRCYWQFSAGLVGILLSFLVAANYFAWNQGAWNIVRVSSAVQKVSHDQYHLVQIVSPYVASKEGDDFYPLDFNQWAAMESIRRSLERAPKNDLTVDFVCAVSQSEHRILVQADLPCHRFLVLERSTRTEYPDIQPQLELPFIFDMIDGSLQTLSNQSFHVMIMNADIGLSKDFYSSIMTVLRKHDAFSINRMSIPMEDIQPTTNSTDLLQNQLDLVIAQGKNHPGYDLFCMSDTVLERISFGDFFLGRPPWGSNIHLMLQIMADHYTNIKSSPFGTFHLGNNQSRWKMSSTDFPREDKAVFIPTGFCPSKNWHPSDALAIQNEENCGVWFMGDNASTSNLGQTESQAFLPGFVRPAFEYIFWNSYKEFLKFDARGLPHERKYETPKQKRKADGLFTRNKLRSEPHDPLQPLSAHGAI